jgi:hypothetical protein
MGVLPLEEDSSPNRQDLPEHVRRQLQAHLQLRVSALGAGRAL